MSTVFGGVVVIAGYGCSVLICPNENRGDEKRGWDVLDNILAAWRAGYLLADCITAASGAVPAFTLGSCGISRQIGKTLAQLRRRTSIMDRTRPNHYLDMVYDRLCICSRDCLQCG